MIKEIRQHKQAYSVLGVVLIAIIVLFLHAWPDRVQQRIIAIGLGVFYFCWGVVVHRKHSHISSKVVFEYLAISTLASAILLLLLQ